jgi:antitoxin YefM
MDAIESYGNSVRLVEIMDSVSVNKFRDNLKAFVERVVGDHAPIKVTRRAGEDFVVMSAEDWEREQETLYVLQNSDLMRQIADSAATHISGSGYRPGKDQLDEIAGL